MTYLFTRMKDNWHELQTLAQEDWDKEYKKSCVKAVKDIAEANKKRERLTKESKKLERELLEAYDSDNQEEVSEVLEKIAKNVQ